MEQLDQVIRELHKQAREADATDRHRAQVFKSLVATPGWAEYVKLLDTRIQLFADTMMMPAGSVDGMIALEHVKGTMRGLILARDLPSVIIQAMDQYLRDQRAAGPREDDGDDDGA